MLENDTDVHCVALSEQIKQLTMIETTLIHYNSNVLFCSDIIKTISTLKKEHARLYLNTNTPDCSEEIGKLLNKTRDEIQKAINLCLQSIKDIDIHDKSLEEGIGQFLKKQHNENDALALAKTIGICLLVLHIGTEQFERLCQIFSPFIQQISTSDRPQLLEQANKILSHEKKAQRSADICWSIARFSAYFSIMSGLFAMVSSMFYENIGTNLGICAASLLSTALIFHVANALIEKYSPFLPTMYYRKAQLTTYDYPDQEGKPKQRASFATHINGNIHHLFANISLVQDESERTARLLQQLKDKDSTYNDSAVAASSCSINIV